MAITQRKTGIEQKYKHKFQTGSSMRVMDIKDYKNERPQEQGLSNVYPELAVAGLVRSGLSGIISALKPSPKNAMGIIDNAASLTRNLQRKQDVITKDAYKQVWNSISKTPTIIRRPMRRFLHEWPKSPTRNLVQDDQLNEYINNDNNQK